MSKFSTPRKLVISVDTAWLLTVNQNTSGLKLYYDGLEPLKGVLNDKPYPIFWIDCDEEGSTSHDFNKSEDKLLGRRKADDQDVRDLADAFLISVSASIPHPFFYAENNIPSSFEPPSGFEARLDSAKAQLKKIYQNQGGEPNPESAEPPEPRVREPCTNG